MTEPIQAKNRDPETIIADWLLGFTGGSDDLDEHRPDAQTIIRWLRDEGWQITRVEVSRE
jgi:hypothetical protein